MDKYEKVFESDRIYYVKLSEGLINDYLVMLNDAELRKNIGLEAPEITYEGEAEWLKSKLAENAKCFSMIEKETGDYIGNIEIMEVKDGVAELGITITPAKQNNHFGTEAMKAIIAYGKQELPGIGYDLNVHADNPRAIKCYENVGFEKDGAGRNDGDIHMKYVG